MNGLAVSGVALARRIDAKAPDETRSEVTQGPMLQALLEDRFKLKVHRETSDGPVYELTVGKNGPKLNGEFAGNRKQFAEKLEIRGFEPRKLSRKGGRGYQGISTLKTEAWRNNWTQY